MVKNEVKLLEDKTPTALLRDPEKSLRDAAAAIIRLFQAYSDALAEIYGVIAVTVINPIQDYFRSQGIVWRRRETACRLCGELTDVCFRVKKRWHPGCYKHVY